MLIAEGAEAQAVIAEIIANAIRSNPERKISGALFFNPHTSQVMQILEGPAPAVHALYATIREDPRHEQCTTIASVAITHEQRLYHAFGMEQGHAEQWFKLPAPIWAGQSYEWSQLSGGLGKSFKKRDSLREVKEEDVDWPVNDSSFGGLTIGSSMCSSVKC